MLFCVQAPVMVTEFKPFNMAFSKKTKLSSLTVLFLFAVFVIDMSVPALSVVRVSCLLSKADVITLFCTGFVLVVDRI